MKYLYTVLLMFAFPFISNAQTTATSQFATQLKKVIADAPADFESYRKEKVQEIGSDVVYASKMNLQGTTENKINRFSDGSSFMATIASVLSEKQAKTQVDEWKRRLESILGKGYEVMPYRNDNKESLSEGYILIGDKNTLTIDYINYKNEQNYNIYLIILNK
jgi:hypothetical protein